MIRHSIRTTPSATTTKATRRTVAVAPAAAQPATAHATAAQAPLATATAAALMLLASTAASPSLPSAHAIGPVSIKLEDIRAERVECAAGTGTVGGVSFSGSTTAAACLDIHATATNPEKKTLYSADVFGRLYDSSGEPLLDDSENARIAYIDELPAGKSEVRFLLRVPANQYEKGKVEFRSFKASAFSGKNLPKQAGLNLENKDGAGAGGDCEVTGTCDEEALESMIR